ncbi:MAG TPA: hypothetical protein VEQ85_05495, partial [Lacipirellulaceae bacterium]|nr:hypothetical protein [Lacipirellulaceae bacterium]
MVVSYPVGDLLDSLGANSPGVQPPDPGGPAAPDADFDRLIDLVVSTIDVESWQRNGTGEGEIMPFPRNSSLVVSQTRRVHQQIAELLEQLRSISVTVKAEEIIPFIQSRAAHGQAGDPQALRVLPRNAHGEAVMEG